MKNRANETENLSKSQGKREKTNVGKMKMKTKYENWMEDENAPELKRSNHQINVPSSDACAPCYIPIVVYRYVMHTQKSSPFHSVYFSTSQDKKTLVSG